MKIDTNELLAINDILVDFDFGRVEKAMEAINWRWELPKVFNEKTATKENLIRRVPTAVEMKRRVKDLLLATITNEKTQHYGGFETKFEKDDDKFSLTLQFVCEDMTIKANKSKESPTQTSPQNEQQSDNS